MSTQQMRMFFASLAAGAIGYLMALVLIKATLGTIEFEASDCHAVIQAFTYGGMAIGAIIGRQFTFRHSPGP